MSEIHHWHNNMSCKTDEIQPVLYSHQENDDENCEEENIELGKVNEETKSEAEDKDIEKDLSQVENETNKVCLDNQDEVVSKNRGVEDSELVAGTDSQNDGEVDCDNMLDDKGSDADEEESCCFPIAKSYITAQERKVREESCIARMNKPLVSFRGSHANSCNIGSDCVLSQDEIKDGSRSGCSDNDMNNRNFASTVQNNGNKDISVQSEEAYRVASFFPYPTPSYNNFVQNDVHNISTYINYNNKFTNNKIDINKGGQDAKSLNINFASGEKFGDTFKHIEYKRTVNQFHRERLKPRFRHRSMTHINSEAKLMTNVEWLGKIVKDTREIKATKRSRSICDMEDSGDGEDTSDKYDQKVDIYNFANCIQMHKNTIAYLVLVDQPKLNLTEPTDSKVINENEIKNLIVNLRNRIDDFVCKKEKIRSQTENFNTFGNDKDKRVNFDLNRQMVHKTPQKKNVEMSLKSAEKQNQSKQFQNQKFKLRQTRLKENKNSEIYKNRKSKDLAVDVYGCSKIKSGQTFGGPIRTEESNLALGDVMVNVNKTDVITCIAEVVEREASSPAKTTGKSNEENKNSTEESKTGLKRHLLKLRRPRIIPNTENKCNKERTEIGVTKKMNAAKNQSKTAICGSKQQSNSSEVNNLLTNKSKTFLNTVKEDLSVSLVTCISSKSITTIKCDKTDDIVCFDSEQKCADNSKSKLSLKTIETNKYISYGCCSSRCPNASTIRTKANSVENVGYHFEVKSKSVNKSETTIKSVKIDALDSKERLKGYASCESLSTCQCIKAGINVCFPSTNLLDFSRSEQSDSTTDNVSSVSSYRLLGDYFINNANKAGFQKEISELKKEVYLQRKEVNELKSIWSKCSSRLDDIWRSKQRSKSRCSFSEGVNLISDKNFTSEKRGKNFSVNHCLLNFQRHIDFNQAGRKPKPEMLYAFKSLAKSSLYLSEVLTDAGTNTRNLLKFKDPNIFFTKKKKCFLFQKSNKNRNCKKLNVNLENIIIKKTRSQDSQLSLISTCSENCFDISCFFKTSDKSTQTSSTSSLCSNNGIIIKKKRKLKLGENAVIIRYFSPGGQACDIALQPILTENHKMFIKDRSTDFNSSDEPFFWNTH